MADRLGVVAAASPVGPPPVSSAGGARAIGRMLLTHVWLTPSLLLLLIGRWRIGLPGLWPDELATLNAAVLPRPDLLQLLGNIDAVDAPYYLVMHYWVRAFGVSEIALRLPSLFAMAAAAGLVAVLGKRLFGPDVGLLAGLLFAVHPIAARYGQEARGYAFTVLFGVLATLVLTTLLARPTWWRALLYGLSLAGAGLAHMVAMFLIAGHAAALVPWWWRHRRAGAAAGRWSGAAGRWDALGWWAAGVAVAVLVVLPLGVLGFEQRHSASWIREPQARELLAAIDGIHGSGVVAGLLLGVALLGWRRGWPRWLLVSWAVVPVLALYLVSVTALPLYYTRYLLFTAPALVLLAAAGITGRFRQGLVVVLAVALVGVPQQLAYRASDGHRYGTREVARLINRYYQPGDGIAYALNEPVIPWGARDLVARYVRRDHRPTDVFAVSPQRTGGRFLAQECADAQLAACVGNTPRLWVVRYRTHPDPLAGIGSAKETVLRDEYAVTRVWLVTAFTVALYERRSGG